LPIDFHCAPTILVDFNENSNNKAIDKSDFIRAFSYFYI
jgi:hypothetical protein